MMTSQEKGDVMMATFDVSDYVRLYGCAPTSGEFMFRPVDGDWRTKQRPPVDGFVRFADSFTNAKRSVRRRYPTVPAWHLIVGSSVCPWCGTRVFLQGHEWVGDQECISPAFNHAPEFRTESVKEVC